MRRLLRLDWEAIAGVLAATIALILHLLHVVKESVLLAIALVLLALLLIRDLRREHQTERAIAAAEHTEAAVRNIQSALRPSDVLLIGPAQLRAESRQFARRGHGEVTFFNVCLQMFRAQATFDTLLRPFIENPLVTSIQFVSDHREEPLWRAEIAPKIAACSGGGKVAEPLWCALQQPVSFIHVEATPNESAEALLSFWGEPFMAISADASLPRYVFHVREHSELLPRLKELERQCRLRA